jgi:hypothetical protein
MAQPVYRMGDDTYVLNEEICGSWIDNGTHKALTYFFDIAVVETAEMLNQNVSAVLEHFESLISSTFESHFSREILVYPNPASEYFALDFGDYYAALNLELYDISGKKVIQWNVPRNGKVEQFSLPSGLQNGVYLLKVSSGERSYSQRLQIQR